MVASSSNANQTARKGLAPDEDDNDETVDDSDIISDVKLPENAR